MIESSLLIVPFAAALAALSLAAVLFARSGPGSLHRTVGWLLIVTGVAHVAHGLGASPAGHLRYWWHIGLAAGLLQAASIVYVGVAILKPASSTVERTTRWRARAVLALAVLLGGAAVVQGLVTRTSEMGPSSTIMLGTLGRAAYVFVVIALALGLTQLEQILRQLPHSLRYRLKIVLIGVGTLAGYQIFEASRLLLVPMWRSEHLVVEGVATLISVALICYGFGRLRFQAYTAKVYVSHQALYGSLSLLIIGLYLIAVGGIAEWIHRYDQAISIDLSTLLVFLATVVLTIGVLSRSVRTALRRVVARHLHRTKYDYRAKWLEVTDCFQGATTLEGILDRLFEWLARTFGAGRISVWLRVEADGRFHQVRSLNSMETTAPVEASHPIIARLAGQDDPIVAEEFSAHDLDQQDPFLQSTQAVLWVPIRAGNQLVAFVALSKEFRGDQYGTDDKDLLRAVARHVGVLLSHAQLADERGAAAEMEALHKFSTFCLHDLKNLATRLSLVVHNAREHGGNPDFQESVMKTVDVTAKRIMSLISKLSLRPTAGDPTEVVDLRTVIDEAVKSLDRPCRVKVTRPGPQPAYVRFGPEQLQQILLNLILNAQQAANGQGDVQISTRQFDGTVVVTVRDSGPGIPDPQLRTLFRPFQTTKSGGLGIGLYQTKQLIEASGGRIRVESVPGQGTTVQVELPVADGVQSRQQLPQLH